MKIQYPDRLMVAALMLLAAAFLQGQVTQTSRVAYVYPAGGQAGTTFEVIVGGKGINRIREVEISGGGVQGEFVTHTNNYQQRLQEHLRIVQMERSGKKINFKPRFDERPEIEVFTRLEQIPDEDLRIVTAKWQQKERVQRNRELAELAVLKLTIAPNAKPGMREMRLVTSSGAVTNPIRFMVNTLPETKEYEPNDTKTPEVSHLELPAIMNGQIMPGDEDRFSFDAVEGQQLVIQVKARELVPYLADAVPGWFQAVIAVEDDGGNEVAYADDFQFNPDPALLFTVPATGKYHVIIRDSIFRGREDFVYRIAVGELPFITGIYPLGAQKGTQAAVAAYGWNLPASGFNLNTRVQRPMNKKGLLQANGTISNYVHYTVGELPESAESNPNDERKLAELAVVNSVINGRIEQPGDVDFYKFKAHEGQLIKLSTHARRLYSPVDTLIRVFDSKGTILAWNDDMEGCGNMTDRSGLITHNSDSELSFTAPATGMYFAQVSDTQNQGGPTHAYRLSIEDPKPDFDVYVTPSGITIPAGGGAKANLHVRRINGYTGPIDVRIANRKSDLSISGGHIPENCDSIPIVISTNKRVVAGKSGINMVASATVDGQQVTRQVIPADDITQAFITHHLVESDILSAYILRNFQRPPGLRIKDSEPAVLSKDRPVTIPLAMEAPRTGELTFELEEAPECIDMETLESFTGKSLRFTATGEVEESLAGNLIVSVYYQPNPTNRNKNPRKVPVGVLPAIPYRIQ